MKSGLITEQESAWTLDNVREVYMFKNVAEENRRNQEVWLTVDREDGAHDDDRHPA